VEVAFIEVDDIHQRLRGAVVKVRGPRDETAEEMLMGLELNIASPRA
jgi:hypothetical protein